MAGLTWRRCFGRVVAVAIVLGWQVQCHAAPGRLGRGEGVDIPVGRIFAVTILCLMLAALVALAIKRRGGIRLAGFGKLLRHLPADRRVHIVETRRASQYADVCLVRCDDREYLALCSQHQFMLLRETVVAPAAEAPPCE